MANAHKCSDQFGKSRLSKYCGPFFRELFCINSRILGGPPDGAGHAVAPLGAAGAVPEQAGAARRQRHEQLRVEAHDQRLEALLLACGALNAREPGGRMSRRQGLALCFLQAAHEERLARATLHLRNYATVVLMCRCRIGSNQSP